MDGARNRGVMPGCLLEARRPNGRTFRVRATLGGFLPTLAVALSWLSASVASACPDCSIGRVARAQVWSDDFALHLLGAAAPFILVVVASIWAERADRAGPKPHPTERMSAP